MGLIGIMKVWAGCMIIFFCHCMGQYLRRWSQQIDQSMTNDRKQNILKNNNKKLCNQYQHLQCFLLKRQCPFDFSNWKVPILNTYFNFNFFFNSMRITLISHLYLSLNPIPSTFSDSERKPSIPQIKRKGQEGC